MTLHAMEHETIKDKPKNIKILIHTLDNNTFNIEYKSLEQIPSHLIKDTLLLEPDHKQHQDIIEFKCPRAIPYAPFNLKQIAKTFIYANDIISSFQNRALPPSIKLTDIIPCTWIADYFGMNEEIMREFAFAYLENQKIIENMDFLEEEHEQRLLQDLKRIIDKQLPFLDNVQIDKEHVLQEIPNNENQNLQLNLSSEHINKYICGFHEAARAFSFISQDQINLVVRIKLAGNYIFKIQLDEIVKKFPSLKLVDLSSNRIKLLDDEFMKHLPDGLTVILHNNPIDSVTSNRYPRQGCRLIVDNDIYQKYKSDILKILTASSTKIKLKNIQHNLLTSGITRYALIGGILAINSIYAYYTAKTILANIFMMQHYLGTNYKFIKMVSIPLRPFYQWILTFPFYGKVKHVKKSDSQSITSIVAVSLASFIGLKCIKIFGWDDSVRNVKLLVPRANQIALDLTTKDYRWQPSHVISYADYVNEINPINIE